MAPMAGLQLGLRTHRRTRRSLLLTLPILALIWFGHTSTGYGCQAKFHLKFFDIFQKMFILYTNNEIGVYMCMYALMNLV